MSSLGRAVNGALVAMNAAVAGKGAVAGRDEGVRVGEVLASMVSRLVGAAALYVL